MPAPRGPNARHERNLERMLEPQASDASPADLAPGAASADSSGGADVAAKLARQAAQREAARRAGERPPADPPGT